MARKSGEPPVIMISSSVYGIEELLDRVYAVLTGFGYNVWSSHSGTMPVLSSMTAFENCIKNVEDCDLFFGLITPHYGTGVPPGEIGITHQELIKAIELNKPRWLLAHDHVIFARTLLAKLGHETAEERAKLSLKRSDIMDDLRVIDMYEAGIRHNVRLLDRKGNWVQKFVNDEDALRYATAQFYRFQEVERFLEEHLSNPVAVMTKVGEDQA